MTTMHTTTPAQTHIIGIRPATANEASYGIAGRSTYVYRTSRSSSPTRITIWDNTGRPNPRNGQPVNWGQYGPISGGNGQYLDPNNQATDAPTSYLIGTEATCIDAYGTGTGTAASGQVYSPEDAVIRPGDRIGILRDAHTPPEWFTAVFTNNGYGYLTPA
jgi:hypothetical protein